MFVKKVLTRMRALLWLRLFGPVESGPDGAGGVVAVDAPVGGEGADDVESVGPVGVGDGWGPGAAVVLDFDAGAVAWIDSGSDGEGGAGQARVAVDGGVGREFGGA